MLRDNHREQSSIVPSIVAEPASTADALALTQNGSLVDLDDQKTRAFLWKTIGPDPSNLAWGTRRVHTYLRHLQKLCRAPEIRTSLSKYETLDEALGWIEKYDPHLHLFAQYHRDFERSRAKAIGLYAMGDEIHSKEEQLRKRLGSQPYLLARSIAALAGDAELCAFEIEQTDTSLTVVLGETVTSTTKLPVPEGVLAGLWDQMKNYASQYLPDFRELKGVVASATVTARVVTTVTLDFQAKLVQISTDTSRVNRAGDAVEADYSRRFREGLEYTLKAVPDADAVAEATLTKAKITGKVASEFRKMRKSDRLAVPYAIVHEVNDTHAISEKITDEIRSQKLTEVAKKVRSYYESNKSFDNFFTQHQEHDPDSVARVHRNLQTLGYVSESGCTCFVFFVRPRREGDMLVGGDQPSAAYVIDSVKVTLDPENGIIRGDSKEDTTERIDVVLAEIRNLL